MLPSHPLTFELPICVDFRNRNWDKREGGEEKVGHSSHFVWKINPFPRKHFSGRRIRVPGIQKQHPQHRHSTSCQQQSHLHPRSQPPARRGSLHTLPVWLQSSPWHIHTDTAEWSWEQGPGTENPPAGVHQLTHSVLGVDHHNPGWALRRRICISYIKVRTAGSRLKAWNFRRLHLRQGQGLSPTSVCSGVACAVTQRCLDLAFSRNMLVWKMHKQAHRRFQSGAFCPFTFKYFSDLAQSSFIMSPLKEARQSSEHVGLTFLSGLRLYRIQLCSAFS